MIVLILIVSLFDLLYLFCEKFVNFFVLAICFYNWSCRVIHFLNNLNYLEVVLQNYYYCERFYLVNFGHFTYIDKMICLVLCTFVVYLFILVILLFLSTFDNAVSVSSAIVTPFLKKSSPLKFGFFSYMFKISVIFLDESTSESCTLFICVKLVCILLMYCSLRFLFLRVS